MNKYRKRRLHLIILILLVFLASGAGVRAQWLGTVTLPERTPVRASDQIFPPDAVWEELRLSFPDLQRWEIEFNDDLYAALSHSAVIDYATWFARYFLTRFRSRESDSYFRTEKTDCDDFARAWTSLLAFSLANDFPQAGALVGVIKYYPAEGGPRHVAVVWRDEGGFNVLEPQARLHPKWDSIQKLETRGKVTFVF